MPVRSKARASDPIRIAIYMGKGGVGKSTTTMMLCLLAARRGDRVLTVDLDPECGASRDFLGSAVRSNPHNIKTYLESPLPEPPAVIPSGIENLDILPSCPDEQRFFRHYPEHSTRLQEGLSLLGKQYRWILMDVPNQFDNVAEIGLIAADYVILPVELTVDCSERIPTVLRILDEARALNPNRSVLGALALASAPQSGQELKLTAKERLIYRDYESALAPAGASLFSTIMYRTATTVEEARSNANYSLMHWTARRRFTGLYSEIVARIRSHQLIFSLPFMAQTANASRVEQRREQRNTRRKTVAASVVETPEIVAAPQASHTATVLAQAVPRELVSEGLIELPHSGQPRTALYDPTLLAPNPQRGRVIDRGLDELAQTLDEHGQQEPIIARLVTDTDRKRWPEAFTDRHVLLILKGHRLYFAQSRSLLHKLRVELVLPDEAEDDLTYSRRGLQRTAIKMMHSQSSDIFDKVNQYRIWLDEFALAKPKKADVAGYFDISDTEAQRLKVVSQLDNDVAQRIINAERRPAEEIVYLIANRPVHEHDEALRRFGHLTVTGARRMLAEEKKAGTQVSGAGRPRNYVFPVRSEDSDVAYIATSLTPQQWRDRGGARAFWDAMREIVNSRELQDRLRQDLD